MDKNKDEEGFLAWLNLFVNLLRVLIYLAIAVFWFVEIVINPNNNHDFYMQVGRIYSVSGVKCRNEEVPWALSVDAIEKKKVTITRWIDKHGEASDSERVEYVEHSDFAFPCEDGEVNIGLIWSFDKGTGVRARIHPQIETWEGVRNK